MTKQTKRKTCKTCKTKFTPSRELQPTCTSIECMSAYADKHLKKSRLNKKKLQSKERNEFKANDKTHLKKTAQPLINKYARLRDERENGKRCCTCNITTGKMDGGHFLPTSGYSAIRYNTNQIFQQCIRCNQHNHGMPKEYRVFMVERYGESKVIALEATKNVPRSYDVDYYKKLIRVVRKKIKRLEMKR